MIELLFFSWSFAGFVVLIDHRWRCIRDWYPPWERRLIMRELKRRKRMRDGIKQVRREEEWYRS